MSVVVVGLHERDTPLELLEMVAVPEADMPKALASLRASPHLAEVVILSTCLRTEVYAVVERFHDGLADIESFFETRSNGAIGVDHPLATLSAAPGVPAVPVRAESGGAAGGTARLYCSIDDEAAAHLFAVAAGINSAVLGEGEVLRQVRQAVEVARAENVAGPVLEAMFRHAVEVGKRARTETSIARGITSLSQAAVALASAERGGLLAGCHALVVGAGEMGAGVARSLERLVEPPAVTVASRSRSRAEKVAGEVGSDAIDISALARSLGSTDVLFTCTTAPGLVLTVADVESLMAGRPDRPLTIVDLAVPRDVEPAASSVPGVSLLDMTDISTFAERQIGAREAEIEAVRQIVADELERYRSVSAARSAAPLVSALRARAEALRKAEIDRRGRLVGSLDEAGRDELEAMTKAIVAKLLHDPTAILKESAGTPRGERLAEALRALFDL
jgi:glutamyl-tRNA reductase